MFALADSTYTVLPWAAVGRGRRSQVDKCRSPGMEHINDHSNLLKVLKLCSLKFNHFVFWPPPPSSQLYQLPSPKPVLEYPTTSLLSPDLCYLSLHFKLPISLVSMMHPFNHSPAIIIYSLTWLSNWSSMDDSINKVTRE